jgi:hypothetical protein
MEEESNTNKSNNYWIILVIVLLFVIAALVFSQSETKSKKKKTPRRNQQGWYDNNQRQDSPINDEDNDNNEEPDPHQDFIEKGYSKRDIKELTGWELEASEVPDLKAEKRRGVVNTLAVSGEAEKGSCSQLVIILKKSPHVNSKEPQWTKIKQSGHFADTSNINEIVIRFAIAKIIEQGYNWKYDVYVLQANSNSIISGTSAGSGVYMAFLSACYSDCAIPKNLAITGELRTEKKEIPNQTESIPKKYQWQTNRCAQCNKRSQVYHFIYDKTTGKLEKNYFSNAVNPDSQWVFCTWKCYNDWWDENVYNCSECGRQRFGNCSCCSKYSSWVWGNKDDERFCSEKCINKRYPKKYEEGKIVAIGGIRGKITAAVEKGCNIIIISKENSSNYYDEVPLSVQAKVKKLYEVENYKDLQKLFPF